MAFLTGFMPVAVTQMTQPNAIPWEWLILEVFDFIVEYGWRIALFTVILKLVFFPLDIYQRYKMRKNQKITERIRPELEKLQKTYANDPQTLQQKQMALNKREGYSYLSACLPALVTVVVFMWLFVSLNNISQYMIMKQYTEWCDIYDAKYSEYIAKTTDYDSLSENDKQGVKNAAEAAAQNAVFEYYNGKNGNKETFLWVKNIWSPDVPWRTPILEYKDFESAVGDWGKKPEISGLTEERLKELMNLEKYGAVTKKLSADAENAANGFLILPILAAGLSFLSQFISMRQQKKSGMVQQNDGSMKMMMVIFPVLMLYFSVGYTAAFSLYMVVNSIVSLLLNLLSTAVIGVHDKHEAFEAANTVIKYGRPDPNETMRLRQNRTDGVTTEPNDNKDGKGKKNG